jgi:UDP-galactopyranose mutase
VEQLYAVARKHEQHDVALASFRELFLACASALWRAHDGNGRKMNFVVIGAGLTGSVIARILAENGFRCRVIEKENHVAGNCHTDRDPATGILKHHFGPHTLHSDNERVWKFIEPFTTIYPYAHRKEAWVKGKAYPFTINIETVNQFFGEQLSEDNIAGFLRTKAAPFCTDSPANFEEAALASLGEELYEGFFRGYTKKQWGRDPKDIPASVFRRLPIHFKKDANVFHHKRQGQPRDGYTRLVEKILKHENIDLEIGRRFSRDTEGFSHLFYSGQLDEYFDYAYGRLPYRTPRFEHEV